MSDRAPAEATAPVPTAALSAGLAAATLEPPAGAAPATGGGGSGMAAPQAAAVAAVPVAAVPVSAVAGGAAAPPAGAAAAPPPDPARPRNRIQVSREKRPLNFFIGLAKKFLVNEEEVELSGLGLGMFAGGWGGKGRGVGALSAWHARESKFGWGARGGCCNEGVWGGWVLKSTGLGERYGRATLARKVLAAGRDAAEALRLCRLPMTWMSLGAPALARAPLNMFLFIPLGQTQRN